MTTPNFEDFQKFSKQHIERNAVHVDVTKGPAGNRRRVDDYSKKAFAEKSPPVVREAVGRQIRRDGVRSRPNSPRTAYEGFVAQASKINQLFVTAGDPEAFQAGRDRFRRFSTEVGLFPPSRPDPELSFRVSGVPCEQTSRVGFIAGPFLVASLLRDADLLAILTMFASASGASVDGA